MRASGSFCLLMLLLFLKNACRAEMVTAGGANGPPDCCRLKLLLRESGSNDDDPSSVQDPLPVSPLVPRSLKRAIADSAILIRVSATLVGRMMDSLPPPPYSAGQPKDVPELTQLPYSILFEILQYTTLLHPYKEQRQASLWWMVKDVRLVCRGLRDGSSLTPTTHTLLPPRRLTRAV